MSKRQHSVQFSTVAKVLLVSLFLGGSGVGYVLQKSQIRTLRTERKKNAAMISRLVDQQRQVDLELSKSTRPSQIIQFLKDHDVLMQPTNLREVYTVQEPKITTASSDVSLVRK